MQSIDLRWVKAWNGSNQCEWICSQSVYVHTAVFVYTEKKETKKEKFEGERETVSDSSLIMVCITVSKTKIKTSC